MLAVFILANNYHSIEGLDIRDEIKDDLKIQLITEFHKKHLYSYLKNGHNKYGEILNITSVNDSHEFAECCFIKAWRV